MNDVELAFIEQLADALSMNDWSPRLLREQQRSRAIFAAKRHRLHAIRLCRRLWVLAPAQGDVRVCIIDDRHFVAAACQRMCQPLNADAIAAEIVRRVECSDHRETQTVHQRAAPPAATSLGVSSTGSSGTRISS